MGNWAAMTAEGSFPVEPAETAGDKEFHVGETRVILLESVASTQDELRRLAILAPGTALCIVAQEQTAGRGRSGREWVAQRGAALLLSFLATPAPASVQMTPLAAGVAAAETLAEFGCPVRLKWPNDLIAAPDGARCKLGGILCEQDAGLPGKVLVGIGINLLAEAAPPGLPATSVAAVAGRAPSQEELLCALLPRLQRWCSLPPSSIRKGWLSWQTGLGESVTVVMGKRTIVGEALGIDEAGALLVREGDVTVTCPAGDVHLQQSPRHAQKKAGDAEETPMPKTI